MDGLALAVGRAAAWCRATALGFGGDALGFADDFGRAVGRACGDVLCAGDRVPVRFVSSGLSDSAAG